MNEMAILRAMYRLSKRGLLADAEQLMLRVRCTRSELRVMLRTLSNEGLIERRDAESATLTMAGLVVAVAYATRRPAARVRRRAVRVAA